LASRRSQCHSRLGSQLINHIESDTAAASDLGEVVLRTTAAIDTGINFHYSRTMEIFEALEAFSSLSQETRLRVFKLIIEYGGTGLGPKQMVEELKIPDNTLSFHLSHLTKSGLVSSRREGRQLFYTANTELVTDLIDFLKENCCTRDSKSKKAKRC